MQVEYVIWATVGVWLIALTVSFFLQRRFFNKLTENVEGKELKAVLKKLLKNQKDTEKVIKEIKKELVFLTEDGKLHVQKTGLVRFNPFREIGGDHSFSLAILDGKDTGIVVTGLHTRERTRIYAKTINKGESRLDLSDEEKKAIDLALKGK